jgi:hypothetical protein
MTDCTLPRPTLTKEELLKELTMLLNWNNIAGIRNVSAIKRLEALHRDVAALAMTQQPHELKKLIKKRKFKI